MFPDKTELNDFEILSSKKFLILCIVTFNLYNTWWIYKAWRFFRDQQDHQVRAALRTIFPILFLFGLFKRINIYAKAHNNNIVFSSFVFYLAYIVVGLLVLFPIPFSLLAFLSPIFLVPALKSINQSIRESGDYLVVENEDFSHRQIVLLVIGGFFWTFIILGLIAFIFSSLVDFLKP